MTPTQSIMPSLLCFLLIYRSVNLMITMTALYHLHRGCLYYLLYIDYCLYSSLFLQGHMNQLSFFFSFVPFILLELFSI
uniref:Uncharacterized protein n=1 Tax=Amphimedon queenslandica TaxID=400682 RepID=A0A1X7SZ82_AMPQE